MVKPKTTEEHVVFLCDQGDGFVASFNIICTAKQKKFRWHIAAANSYCEGVLEVDPLICMTSESDSYRDSENYRILKMEQWLKIPNATILLDISGVQNLSDLEGDILEHMPHKIPYPKDNFTGIPLAKQGSF